MKNLPFTLTIIFIAGFLSVVAADNYSGYSGRLNSDVQSVKNKKQCDTIAIRTSARCGQCKERIEGNMAFEKGVKDVSLDLEANIVTVCYNPKSTNPDELRKKLSKLGYDADDVKADPVAYEKLPPCCKKDAEKH